MNLVIVLLLAGFAEHGWVDTQLRVGNRIREASQPDTNNQMPKKNLKFTVPQWKKFPGFFATVRVRMSDRTELGKVIVLPCGTVYVEHLSDASRKLVKQSLGKLVRSRLGKGMPDNGIAIYTKVIPNRLIQVRHSHLSRETLWIWHLTKEKLNGVTLCRKCEVHSWTQKKGELGLNKKQSILWNLVSGFDLPVIITTRCCFQPMESFRYELKNVVICEP